MISSGSVGHVACVQTLQVEPLDWLEINCIHYPSIIHDLLVNCQNILYQVTDFYTGVGNKAFSEE